MLWAHGERFIDCRGRATLSHAANEVHRLTVTSIVQLIWESLVNLLADGEPPRLVSLSGARLFRVDPSLTSLSHAGSSGGLDHS